MCSDLKKKHLSQTAWLLPCFYGVYILAKATMFFEFKNTGFAGHWWLMPVILATQKRSGRSKFKLSPGK
jgi:hypothetical protein